MRAERQFNFLRPRFTPRTVFLEIGATDCELSLRAAGYVDRVWCVETARGTAKPPCNLRLSGIAGVPQDSVDLAFSETLKDPEEVARVLAPGGVWFVYGWLVPAQVFREAGFSRVQYYAGGVRVPGALARMTRSATTAAYK